MPPPDPIQAASALVSVCLPDGSTEGVKILVTPAAAQQTPLVSENAAVAEYRDDERGLSYARPVEITRQPTNIFQSNPLRRSEQRTALALGDALQIWINQQEDLGESVDPRLLEIAQILHSGRLPDARDADFQTLVNQSFGDTALDAIIHSVALECDTSPNRHLHAQALSYSLAYFLHHDSSNPAADAAIRSSLITALANSQSTSTRSILATAALGTSPQVQAQVSRALSQSNGAQFIVSSGGDNLNFNARSVQASPVASAQQAGQRLGFVASVANGVYSAATQLGEWVQNHPHEFIAANLISMSPTLSAGYVNAVLITRGLEVLFPTLGNSIAAASTPPESVVSEFFRNYAAPDLMPNPVQAGGVDASIESELRLVYSDQSAMCLVKPDSTTYQMGHVMFVHTGSTETQSRILLNSMPSPFLLGYASIQGGIQQALNAQAYSTLPVYASAFNANPAYRVAAISSASGHEFDQDNFQGSSQEGSSQGQGGNDSSHSEGGQGQQHPDSEPPLADIYLNHRH